jgi:DNA polymerase IV
MESTKKIIHVDCDCFFAAVEQLDNPALKGLPVAVGGDGRRGVLATASYDARKYGLHAAMPGFIAKQKCPHVVFVPPRMARYKEISEQIKAIFYDYTELVEPVSIDEAYLDVTDSEQCSGSATLIAAEIRQRVFNTIGITVSAGVAPNKMIAKVASDWQKPDGLTVVTPSKVLDFMQELPVKCLHGVGKKSQQRMTSVGIKTCGDLQTHSQTELIQLFGQFGARLHQMCRGIDKREVKTNYERKSYSLERTFLEDLQSSERCEEQLPKLIEQFKQRYSTSLSSLRFDKIRLKMKFNNFESTTVEMSASQIELSKLQDLVQIAWQRQKLPVRLLGFGVKLATFNPQQLEFSFVAE